MYNSILVPLDGSRRAEAILPHVENLAQRYNAKVIFLQVIEPAPVVVGPEAAYTTLHQHELAEWTKQAESYLAARQGEFREKGIEAQMRTTHIPMILPVGATIIAYRQHRSKKSPHPGPWRPTR